MATAVPTRRPMFKNILIATDFSTCSESLLPYARSLALHYDSTLYLAHVISPEVLGVDPSMLETVHQNAVHLMEDLELSDQLEGIRHKRILEQGETMEVLAAAIEQENIDLVLVGTHGRTGLKKLVLGSVAEKIFRNATCPVMTIGPRVGADVKRDSGLSHVLLATELKSQHTGPALYAASLARENQAELTVLHVAEADSNVPMPKQLLDMLPPEIELPRAPEAVIKVGDAAAEILDFANRRNVDLIVQGAHRAAPMTTHMMAIAYRVASEAPCPVLTVGAEYK